jgi:glycosyltransferase involved in cell wall biosynthesis
MPGGRRSAHQRVVLLGAFAPSLVRFRGPLIEAMAGRGHRVFAASPGIDETIAQQLRALGATPVDVPLVRASLNPFSALATYRALRDIFVRLRPDVVIAYTITPVTIGALAARAAQVGRFVALVTGLGYAFTAGREPRRLLTRLAAWLLYRRAFRAVSVAVFQNVDDRREFARLRLLPRDLPTGLVNGSGVDVGHFSPAPLPSEPNFLMIARFLKDKGIREFAEAGAQLKREHPAVQVRLVGWLDRSPDAIDAAELQRIEDRGIENLGELADVRPAIAACSVYVLPSYREGTPRSVLEAMAMGRAIVTTDAPGCRETVIDGVNGFLVPPRDAAALLVALRKFVDRPALAAEMGAASRRMAEEKFAVEAVNQVMLDYAAL